MSDIKPFKIAIPDERLRTLKAKLADTTFPDELSDAEASMGAPLADIKRLVKYWYEGFNWRRAEAELNKLPQFTTPIAIPGFSPLDIHFIHQKSSRQNAIPLLFVHGWPGSFYEVTKLLPLLTSPSSLDQPAFHVIAPSLPNFGFSSAHTKKGFGLEQYATTCHNLMLKLGYDSYVTQGGDWGHFITRVMARKYPTHIRAQHSNFPLSAFPKPWKNPLCFLSAIAGIALSPSQRAGLAHSQNYLQEGNGYLRIQDTKPQTLGYSLADSPVGLLAWIHEKLVSWTDSYPWTDDEVLTWISIYYFSTAGPAASVRIYYEASHPMKDAQGRMQLSRDQVISEYVPIVPVAYASFHKELVTLPQMWMHTTGPVVQQSAFDVGGHFAAFEVPELLAEDLRKLFGREGACAGAVEGKSGY